MRALSLAVIAAVFLVVGASACGGDDSDGSTDASAGVIEQIEGICAVWKDTLDERGDFPVADFDPENPSPTDLQAVGAYFASGHPATEAMIAELRELSPPADIENEVESLVSALEAELESAQKQTRAAQAGDVEAFVATLDDAASSQEVVEETADELSGGEGCAF